MIADVDFTVFVWFFVVALIFLALVAAAERWQNRSIEQRPRAYRPDPTYSQPTDCWFDPVRPFFGQILARDERTARAVDHAVYPDNKNEGQAASTADPHSAHGGTRESSIRN